MTVIIKNDITNFEKKFIPKNLFLNFSWLNIIENSFKYKRKYLIINIKKKKILVLPFHLTKSFFRKIFVSLPFSFNLNLNPETEKIIINKLLKHRKVFHKFHDVIIKSNFIHQPKKQYFKTKYFYYKVILKKNYKEKFSKNIKRAIKNKKVKFEIITNTNSKGFHLFYLNYIKSSKNLKTFFYPEYFLYNLFKKLFNNVCIINAYKNGIYLGGTLLIFNNENKEVIYFLSSKSKQGLKISIDKILLSQSMEISFKKGFTIFNLGKVNENNIGLNNFKKQFGSIKYQLNYFSLSKKNYGILDQKCFLKNISQFIIKIMPTKLYIILNNIIFKNLVYY